MKRKISVDILLIILFTILAVAVMGYHPGLEDDGIYLTAIKANLNPSLFPYDAAFFQLQMRTILFPRLMAYFVGVTAMPLARAELLWQLISILLIVGASFSIVSRFFKEASARWAGVAMLVAMLTLPVSATALNLVDQYLHPRALATAFILLAVSRILARRNWQALPFLALGFLIHPLMGAFGISFCCILMLTLCEPLRAWLGTHAAPLPLAALIPFGWVFSPPSQTWLDILRGRHSLLLYQWNWYEWLGIVGPPILFWLAGRFARGRGESFFADFAQAVVIYCIFHQSIAMLALAPMSPIGLHAMEPMRYLHLVYLFMTLFAGAYLGKYLLKASVWRWAFFLALVPGGMFVSQRLLFAGSDHLELPGRPTANPWLQAFAWIRENTPVDAYFAIDPNYLGAPGEDYHGFRALAERSALADHIKDTSVVTLVPELAPAWATQVQATKGWSGFQLADFERLKAKFGVDWVVVSDPAPPGLDCRWHNGALAVCRIQ